MLNNTDLIDGIRKAKNLLGQGKTAESRAVLRYLTRQYPESEEVWLLSERASETLEQKMFCLVQALQIKPESTEAHARMSALQEQAAAGAFEPAALASQPLPIAAVVPPPLLPAREDLEPVSNSLERLPRQTVFTPAKPLPRQAPQTTPNPARQAPTFSNNQKPKFRWWFLLLFIFGITIISIANKADYYWGRFERWQMKSYGNIADYDYRYDSEHKRRVEEYENSASNINSEMLSSLGYFSGAILLAIWFIDGIVGGFMLAIKKMRGSSWAWLLVLLPVVLFPAYLALSGFLGEVMYAISKYSGYSKKKCPQCKGWIPISATRCQHCGQGVE